MTKLSVNCSQLLSDFMPGNPTICRQRAARCIKLANASKNTNDRRKLTELAATWERLADKLKRTHEDSKRTQERAVKSLLNPIEGTPIAGATDAQIERSNIQRSLETPRNEVQQKSEKFNSKNVTDDDVHKRPEKMLDEAIEDTFPASDPVSTEQPV